MLRTNEGKFVFSKKKILFVTTLDLIKCLKQIKQQRLLTMCAPISVLPPNIGTMGQTDKHFPILLFILL